MPWSATLEMEVEVAAGHRGIRVALVVLCLYGFFKEIRPSEPFLTQYLIDPRWVNLSKDDLYNKVYPVWPYAYFSLLVPVFFLTDYLRYKPVIIFEGLSYIATWALLLWGTGVAQMQFMQFTYGIATSTEIAYYSYIYAQVSSEKYQFVSGVTRSALLFGRFSSGFLAQLLTSLNLLDYRQLNLVSFGSVCVAFVASWFLPSVPSSVYFHRRSNADGQTNVGGSGTSLSFAQVTKILWDDLKLAYGNPYVIKWSLWAALSTCANFQVGNYIQGLWEEIKPTTGSEHWQSFENATEGGLNASLEATKDDTEIWNGAVEAATTLAGALAVFVIGFLSVDWVGVGNFCIFVVAVLSSALLYWMSWTDEIWVAYTGYLVYRMMYQVLMTVASFEIVKDLPKDSYALILGINSFVGLGLQVILTTVVNTQLELDPRPQFEVYAICFLFPIGLFALLAILQVMRVCSRRHEDHRNA